MFADRFHQRPLDFPSGNVFGMQNAALGMSAFPGEVVGVVIFLTEPHPPIDQIPDGLGTTFDDHAHDLLMGEVGSGHHGILDMGFEGVFGRKNRGDSSLGEVGRRLGHLPFRDHRNRPLIGDLQGI